MLLYAKMNKSAWQLRGTHLGRRPCLPDSCSRSITTSVLDETDADVRLKIVEVDCHPCMCSNGGAGMHERAASVAVIRGPVSTG